MAEPTLSCIQICNYEFILRQLSHIFLLSAQGRLILLNYKFKMPFVLSSSSIK